MNGANEHALTYILPLLFLLLIVRRNLRERSLRMERLWVYPVILIALALAPLANEPFPGVVALIGFIVALITGAAVGWWRGRLTTISIDPTTHEFTSKASVIGALLIAVVFALRYGIKLALANGSVLPMGLHLDVAGITQGLMIFAVAATAAQRGEMFIRCQRMLSQARGGGLIS